MLPLTATLRRWAGAGTLSLKEPLALVLAATFLNTIGYQAFIPTLPLYLHYRGASPFLIGVIAAGGLLSFGLAQYPAGWLADRFERRHVAAVGTALYAMFFFAYLLPLPLWFLVPYRFLHAASGGLYTPAALALVADTTRRGALSRSFGLWQVALMSGFLVGPSLGGFLAALNLNSVFLTAAAICLISAIPLLAIGPTARRSSALEQLLPPPAVESMPRRLLPVIVVGAAPEYLTGLLTAIWSIFLLAHGGTPWQIGLSFTLFALPSVVLSIWLGGLIDQRGARIVMTTALIGLGVLASSFGLVTAVPLFLVLITLAGVFVAAEKPAVYSEVGRRIPSHELARGQAIVQMTLMVAQTAGALIGGYLLSRSVTATFLSVSVVCVLSLAGVGFLSGRRVRHEES